VYGADKVWVQLKREGIRVARCAIERPMCRPVLSGARRGKVFRVTIRGRRGPEARTIAVQGEQAEADRRPEQRREHYRTEVKTSVK
jgi:hypothetical protein